MINKVLITANEYTNPDGSVREVDQIELWLAGTVFRRDLGNSQGVALAQRIANDAGAFFDDDRDNGLMIFNTDIYPENEI